MDGTTKIPTSATGDWGADGTAMPASQIMGYMCSMMYPIGSIYCSTASVDPGTLFGGTWAVFGAGRVMVSYKAGDTDFGTPGSTGGEKTHVLTTPEMPAHTHTTPFVSGVGLGLLSGGAASGSGVTGSTGGGGSHNNLQPYVVVYMFQRTA